MSRKWILALGVSVFGLPTLLWGGDWPQFRGPNGTALSEEDKLPAEWGKDKNVKWKAEVPGFAWSSPVTWGDKIFVTTAVTDKQAKPKGGGFGGRGGGGGPGGFGGRGGKPPDVTYRWEVYCLERDTGKVVWKSLAVEKKPTIPTHSTNSYATETPVTDGERVYAYFGMHGVYCFDLQGKQLWSKDLGSYPMMAGWGTGSSPVLDGDRLFIQCDNERSSFLVALDKKTGKELWKVARDERSTYSTPFVWRTKARTELVACGGKKVIAYDPATGKVLWELGGLGSAGGGGGGRGGFGGMGGSSNATPVASAELLYVGGGGRMASGTLFAIKAGATGDLTLKDGATSNAGVAWSRPRSAPGTASPLLYKGFLYIVEQRGQLSCYDAKTGKPAYTKERLAGARGFTSSPWAYGDKVFCLDESGQTFVVKAGDKFELLGTNKLNEMFWSSPAISGGALFLRGTDYLYCIKP
jgi:outer membrane protein assembly factor BamB